MVDKGERIFLLEVFVDNVHLENCKVNNKLVKTCVRFKFLNYPFLEIMEDEYCKVPDETCNIKFQSGKSCLFSLRRNPQGSRKPPLNLHVTVVRMETETNSVDVGKTLINLSGSFTNLIQTSNQRADNGNPVSKIIKETYVLTNDRNQTIGDITIFVRLSCFGKIIVTQFQMSGLESKSFLFKAVSDIRGKNFEGSGDAGGVFESSLPQGKSQDQLGLTQSQSGRSLGMGYPGMGPPGMMGPGMMGPGMGGPGWMGPGMGGPGLMAPGMGGPGLMGPGMGGPGLMGPGMGGPGMMSPMMGPPGMVSPGYPGIGPRSIMGPNMSQLGMMGPRMGPPGMDPTIPGMRQIGAGMPGSGPLVGAVQPFGNIGPGPEQGGLDYQNFSATVNGHVLNIKVLRKPKRLKQPEAVFCQREDSSSSSSESEDEIPRNCAQPCMTYTTCVPTCPQHAKPNHQGKNCPVPCSNPCHPCPPGRPIPRVPLCDCDEPVPPCLVCPPQFPCSPPKKKSSLQECPNACHPCPPSKKKGSLPECINPCHTCPPGRPIPRVPLCDCDLPIPPCLVCPPLVPCPPPKKKKEKKKRKSKYPLDAGMYCRADCPLGFPKPPMLVPPNYPVPSIMGASPTSTGDPQNFLISMEPRTDYPPLIQPPMPTCITERDTQYEDTDVGKTGGKKSKGKGKDQKGKGKDKKGKK